MTPDEARRRVGRIDRILWDRTGYDEDPPEEQQRTREALAVLLEHGTEQEQKDAADFFRKRTMSPAETSLVARLYAERGWDSTHPAAEALGGAPDVGAGDRALLLRVFLAAPERHLEVAQAVLKRDCNGPAWAALEALVRRTNDVSTLAAAHDASGVVRREDDFYALLRGKPEEVLQALVAGPHSHWKVRLPMVAGLRAPARLDRDGVVERIRDRGAALVKTAAGDAGPVHRFALYCEGVVRVVSFDWDAARVRRLERFPTDRLAEVVAAHMGGPEVTEDWLQPTAPPELKVAVFMHESGDAPAGR